MNNLNMIALTGRLAFDAKFEDMGTWQKCSFLLKCDHEVINRKEGTTKIETVELYVSCTNKEALVAKNLKKGAEVFIQGKLTMYYSKDPETGKPDYKKKNFSIMAHTLMYSYKLDDAVITEQELRYVDAPKAQAMLDKSRVAPQQQPQPKLVQRQQDPNWEDQELPF